MGGFKLIAIRPLVGCDRRFLKNLKPSQIFKFYNDYTFFDEDDNVINNKNCLKIIGDKPIDNFVKTVEFRETLPDNLYNLKTNETSINISAIVGKNGSGKSSLLEFFYLALYLISEQKGILGDSNYYNYNISKQNSNQSFFQGKLDELDVLKQSVFFEIYFVNDNNIFRLKYDSVKYSKSNGLHFEQLNKNKFEESDSFKLYQLFYSIVINYSIYGLNTRINGDWLKSLFHKNDGYQTPIVINPFRNEGVIDINSEYHLAQSRLLLNIVDFEKNNVSRIIEDFVFEEIQFVLDPNRIEEFRNVSINSLFKEFEDHNKITIVDFFEDLLIKLVNYKLSSSEKKSLELKIEHDKSVSLANKYLYSDDSKNIDYDEVLFFVLKYTIRKVFKICYQYDDYSMFRIEGKHQNNSIYYISRLDRLITKLKIDQSHTTLKLYQILYSVKQGYFKNKEWKAIRNPKNHSNKSYLLVQNKIEFVSNLKMSKTFNQKTKVEDYEQLIPNAFVEPKIYLRNLKNENKLFEFASLSSGEQQLIHSVQSILYHIKNINSVFDSLSSGRTKYSNINLIFDEIELYFHPEYQRNFISSLLNEIKRLDVKNIKGINILFSTHSPFILSDIPHQNILKLEEGESIEYDLSNKTFGSNIHELLATDFYLNKGFMGEFAKNKIQSLIKFLDKNTKTENKEWNQIKVEKFIDIIGEPILRDGLKRLYFKKYNDKNTITKEIKRLQSLLNI